MIQKNLLLAFLSIMIVEKIIVISIKLCCAKKQITSRHGLGMVQNFLRNDTAFGYQEGDYPKTKIHPGDWTGKSDHGASETGRSSQKAIGQREGIRTKSIFAHKLVKDFPMSKANGNDEVNSLKEQIVNLRKKIDPIEADPLERIAFKKSTVLSPYAVNFFSIKIH